MSNPTIEKIVSQWLKENEYDGFFNTKARCECRVGEPEFMIGCRGVGADVPSCQAGYMVDGKCWGIAQSKKGK